jgi:ABC-type dipeptide/oligopeptide/nickel transport system permease subunit
MSVTELAFDAHLAEEGQASGGPVQGRTQWQLTWRRLRSDKVSMISLAVILIMVILAIAAPAIAALTGHDVNTAYVVNGETADGNPVGPGVNGFLLGTDSTGRDLLVRTLYGARISLFVGIVTTLIASVLGVAVGLIAGYFGGIVDTVLARLTDAVLAFPYIVLALALAVVFGPSLTLIVVMITFFSWAGIARIVRGQTLSIKEKEYVEAARSLGAGPFRIMFFDILPNLLAPVLVIGTLYIPNAVVFESTLSYLGLGVQPPTPSWGNMLSDAQNFYQVAWWYLVFPAVALLITTLAFNLLGDGIRDAMDPRTEKLIAARRLRRRQTRRSVNKGNKEALGGIVASGTASADTGKKG